MVLPPRRMRTSPPGNGVPVALSATDPPMSPSAGGAVVNPAATSHATTSVGYRTFERSEEHTSELQSRLHLVCRLLLEKKNKTSTSLQTICYSYSNNAETNPFAF